METYIKPEVYKGQCIYYSKVDIALAQLLKKGSGPVLLVTGKKSYEGSSIKPLIEKGLEGHQFARYSEFSNNPKIEEIKSSLPSLKLENYRTIVAVGGGSPIDVAKILKYLIENKNLDAEVDPSRFQIPLISIPTTSGTGSESTQFATYYKNGLKQSLDHPSLLSEAVILDERLLLKLPKTIAATTGLDALCQAVESFWSVNATEESKSYAKEAIIILKKNLVERVHNPTLLNVSKVMRAASLAGKAINISRTTASHAISYPLTSRFNIPHGHAVALTLHEVLSINSLSEKKEINDPRGKDYISSMMKQLYSSMGLNNAKDCSAYLKELLSELNLSDKLSSFGVQKKDIPTILDECFTPSRIKNNPVQIDRKQIQSILERVL